MNLEISSLGRNFFENKPNLIEINRISARTAPNNLIFIKLELLKPVRFSLINGFLTTFRLYFIVLHIFIVLIANFWPHSKFLLQVESSQSKLRSYRYESVKIYNWDYMVVCQEPKKDAEGYFAIKWRSFHFNCLFGDIVNTGKLSFKNIRYLL